MSDFNTPIIDLRPLSTPRERFLTLNVGLVDPNIIQEAKENRYDQLPVLDSSHQLCGMIATDTARSLLNSGLQLLEESAELDLLVVSRNINLFELLDVMVQHRAVVFRPQSGEKTARHDNFSLVTTSDLNRHQFRADLYPLFASLESSLAEKIE